MRHVCRDMSVWGAAPGGGRGPCLRRKTGRSNIMTAENHFDIAVVGGGPAGIMAAISAAKQGRNVCLFDRKKKPGYPVRCGEAIGLKGFTSVVDLRPEWIRSRIRSMTLVSPSGIHVTVPNSYEGYIIDRKKMECDLTDDAVRAGVSFLSGATVVSVHKKNDRYECETRDGTISAACVILAEGIESRLARRLGWTTHLSPADVHSCAFARIVHKDVVPEACVFYLNSRFAPGGYVWVFHRGDNIANVGLGVLGSNCRAGLPKSLLLSFINEQFKGAEVRDIHCGGVPMGKWIKPLVREGVMLAGDAGHQVNCISGAGIAYALHTGKTAGTVAGQSIVNGQCDYAMLERYEKQWASFYGKQQLRSFSIKEVMVGFTDKFLDDVARSITKSGKDNMSILRIFIKAFARRPLLLFKVIKVLR
jgi:digeranylgeranylglycerophospholipid reductase